MVLQPWSSLNSFAKRLKYCVVTTGDFKGEVHIQTNAGTYRDSITPTHDSGSRDSCIGNATSLRYPIVVDEKLSLPVVVR